MFYLFYGFIWLLTWLPLRALYLLSDLFFPIVYYVVGYRKKVVRKNLEKSFPLKSKRELRKTERKFYRFFCDIFVETMYQIHISEKEMRKRMTFSNVDVILNHHKDGESCFLMSAHYGNWEWTSSLSLWLPSESHLFGIYKQLNNEKFDAFVYRLRTKSKSGVIEKNSLLRKMVQLRKEKKTSIFGMISDQTPTKNNLNYWTQFLNQDTPVLTGTEVLARKFNYPVYYSKITRVKRGYYQCEFSPISLEPSKTAEFEITEKYMQLLQKSIEIEPAYWLWSHKRWKRAHLHNK